MFSNLANSNINVRSIWIQVTSPTNWYMTSSLNVNFLNSILQRANQYDLTNLVSNHYLSHDGTINYRLGHHQQRHAMVLEHQRRRCVERVSGKLQRLPFVRGMVVAISEAVRTGRRSLWIDDEQGHLQYIVSSDERYG
ncbi:hypothetical protein OSTOST_06032 [Ostertagia ostertagi]